MSNKKKLALGVGGLILVVFIIFLGGYLEYTYFGDTAPYIKIIEPPKDIWFVHLIHPLRAKFPDGVIREVYNIGIHGYAVVITPLRRTASGVVQVNPNLDFIYGKEMIIPLYNIRSIDKIESAE